MAIVAKIEINGEVLEISFAAEDSAQAATELLAGACYLGGIEMQSEVGEGCYLSADDALEFHLENLNMHRLAKEGAISHESAARYNERFLFREWCLEGTYMLSGEDGGATERVEKGARDG